MVIFPIKPGTDTITLLTCQNGVAAKTFHADGRVRPYRAGKHFHWAEYRLGSSASLSLGSIITRRCVS